MSVQQTAPKISDLRLLVISPNTPKTSSSGNGTTATTATLDTTSSLFRPFLNALTGTSPSEDIETFAGYTTHPPLAIKNKYYAADVTIWCDEITLDDAAPTDWCETIRSDEAREVREVIGGIVLLLPYDDAKPRWIEDYCKLLGDINVVREQIEDDTGRDIATIAVVQDMTPKAAAERQQNHSESLVSYTQKLEDACLSDHGIFGWDMLHWNPNVQEPTTTNAFGEKLGMARILEILEQTDWSVSIGTSDGNDYELTSIDDFLDDLDDPDIKPKIRPLAERQDPVTAQSDEFQREIMGLHFALEDQSRKETGEAESGDELEVDQMMSLMSRAAEIREEGSTMSKEDREKFARKEVAKLMRGMKLG